MTPVKSPPPRVWLIGEHNPYGVDPRFALWPKPANSAGGRLRKKILGMTLFDYLREFRRLNLVQDEAPKPRWSKATAREAANLILQEATPRDTTLVLFGRRVAEAFGLNFDPFFGADTVFGELGGTLYSVRTLMLPHPSGRCRLWNEPDAIERTREAVGRLAPHLKPLLGKADETRDAAP